MARRMRGGMRQIEGAAERETGDVLVAEPYDVLKRLLPLRSG